ncbi:hypothetical protein EJB05_52733 [Eragrostis curvula]|uniref:UTP23 sensor motif region domain-containing protein n=1 Tax=Eragrostis curvula TaxID=38414 RepID=A0A5J9SRZ1_9POAL|nr:hypothetical protein EJB05_52733 [Eragrostis curvula]
MRVKKRSRHRKAVKFYSTCFGFREPYKVLVDGTFVYHLLTQGLLPADEALRDLLSASRTPVLSTSKCVLAELRRLGKSHAHCFDAASLLATTKCEHDKVIPGVPVIYGLKNSLFIEQPSVQQRKFAQLDEEKRLNMDISEYKKLLKAASEGKTADDEIESGGEQHKRSISSLVKNALGVAEKSKFKRNRAKGPNPLSCRKKKPKPQSSGAQDQGPKADGSRSEKGFGSGRATKITSKLRQQTRSDVLRALAASILVPEPELPS